MRLIAGLGLGIAVLSLAGCGGTESDKAGEKQPEQGESTAASKPSAETAITETEEPETMASARPAQPPAAFMQCRSCHSVEPDQNGIGPSLHGVFGQQAASVPGFNYSPALKGASIAWDRASLDSWITAPMKMVPGTRMVVGIPNPEAREDIIDYLETLK